MEIILGYILPFLVVLTVLVFVHEMGHYLVARWNKVRIEVFSIGFGKEIFGFNDRTGTRWKFSMIPLGGYVKMFGDADASSRPGDASGLSEEERSYAFQSKRLSQRTAIVAAGPIANFLFAIVVLAGVFATVGQPYTPPVVGQVQQESAAQEAGFQAGDRIVALNGDSIERFEEVQRTVRLNPDAELRITVMRDGRELTLTATPQRTEVEDARGNRQEIGILGISRSEMEYRRHDPLTASWQAAKETVNLSGATLQAVGQIITGSRSTDELGGPIRIAQMSGDVADAGVVNLIWFMAILSINLGLINLFPIPMLDGGHLVFYAIEAVRGRPLGEKAQEYGFRIGLALVLTLMIFVTFNDLVQLRVFDLFN